MKRIFTSMAVVPIVAGALISVAASPASAAATCTSSSFVVRNGSLPSTSRATGRVPQTPAIAFCARETPVQQ